jgi:lichenan operon transcriptional antiterminator
MNHSSDNKVLVISSLKNSMTVLLRQTILRWFGNEIESLDFKQPVEVTETILDDYNLFFTTEKGEYYDNGLAMFINIFPNDNDRKNIKLALDGFGDIDDIIQIFQADLFFTFEDASKEEVLQKLTEECEKKYKIEKLHDSVKRREHIGSSYFSKGIAVPHPIQAISSDTFIAIGIARQEVMWDESGNKVNLIMLVHIGKNNRRSFQLWNYLAKLLAEKSMVEDVLRDMDYEHFAKVVEHVLGKAIGKV